MSPAGQDPNQREAMKRLQSAFNRWSAMWGSFNDYPSRLRGLATAADEQRKACLVAELADLEWVPGATSEVELPTELESDRRPGPPESWRGFDAAVEGLGAALVGDGFSTMGRAFGTMAKACNELADELAELEQTPMPGRARRAG